MSATNQEKGKELFSATAQIQPKPTKKARTLIPPPQSARIMERYVAGQSIREIAREEGRDRQTVTKIVRSDEMFALVQEMRGSLYGLGWDALAAVKHALRRQRDAKIAYQLLTDIGVIPRNGELQPGLPSSSYEDRTSRNYWLGKFIEAAVERSRIYDLELPRGLAPDPEESESNRFEADQESTP